MKLYKVTRIWYVLAENQEQAKYVDVSLHEYSIEAHEAQYIPPDWRDAIPAGSMDDKTCGQLLEEAHKGSEE